MAMVLVATTVWSTPAASGEVTTVPVRIEGSNFVRGMSTVVVNAPIDKVRERVLAFGDYPEFMPHYTKCRVLGRTPRGREVFMEVTALHGAVKMWARIEVLKPVMVDGVETHDTRFLQGNVKDLKAAWRLKKLAPDKTELSLELFLLPKVSLPTSLINEANLESSADGVLALKRRTERG